MNNTRTYLAAAAAIAVLLLAAVLNGCADADAADIGKPADESEEAGVPVRIAEVILGDVDDILIRATTIKAPETIRVLPKVSGQIVDLLVEEGRKVDAGDPIVQLDDREARLAEERAETLRDKAEHDYLLAKRKLELEIISREEFLEAQHLFERSEKDYESARLEREKAAVKAPIGGIVVQRHVSLGDTVFPSTPIVTIADLKTLEAEVQIPQDQIERVSVGNDVFLTPVAGSARLIVGDVKRISPVVQTGSGTVKVVINIPADQPGVKPGLFVKARIVTGITRGVTLVPRDAVVIENAMPVLYKIVDGYARRVPVEVGNSRDNLIHVFGDISPGDAVVVVGNGALNDMTKVRISSASGTQD